MQLFWEKIFDLKVIKTTSTFHFYAQMVVMQRRKWPVTKKEDSTEALIYWERYIYLPVGSAHILIILDKQRKKSLNLNCNYSLISLWVVHIVKLRIFCLHLIRFYHCLHLWFFFSFCEYRWEEEEKEYPFIILLFPSFK